MLKEEIKDTGDIDFVRREGFRYSVCALSRSRLSIGEWKIKYVRANATPDELRQIAAKLED